MAAIEEIMRTSDALFETFRVEIDGLGTVHLPPDERLAISRHLFGALNMMRMVVNDFAADEFDTDRT